jgi:hypothetical protein
MANLARRNHRRKRSRITGGSGESSGETTRARSAHGSPTEHGLDHVRDLSRDHKPVVVYVAPTRQFRTIKTFDDIKGLLAQGDSDSVERIVSELHLHVA